MRTAGLLSVVAGVVGSVPGRGKGQCEHPGVELRVSEDQREARKGRWGPDHMGRHLGFTLSEEPKNVLRGD